jgi:hypothetical protein
MQGPWSESPPYEGLQFIAAVLGQLVVLRSGDRGKSHGGVRRPTPNVQGVRKPAPNV